MPARTAASTVARIVIGSPAWKPQATFAEVTRPASVASFPQPSPMSALRSTVRSGMVKHIIGHAISHTRLLARPVRRTAGTGYHDLRAPPGRGLRRRGHAFRL